MDFSDRLNNYDKDYCWQYNIRLNNLEEDLKLLPDGINYQELKVSDFEFKVISNEQEILDAKNFIKRHEWLGKLALNTTHYFGAYYRNVLAGVVTMGVPTAFSNMVGKNTKDLERLISRGACISWSPKNLASHFIMWCIKYMVENTQYRIFSAYSDPTAKELGTIYQACNFYYLGNNFGAGKKYISPYSNKLVSDRCFRARSYYKRYAKDLGIVWQDNYSKGDKILWSNIPDDIEIKLKEYGKKIQDSCEYVELPRKKKYVYVLGKSKIETRRLRKLFLDNNKIYDYPKNR